MPSPADGRAPWARRRLARGAVRTVALAALGVAWWGQGAPVAPTVPGAGEGWTDPPALALADSAVAWLRAAGAAEGTGRVPPRATRTLALRVIPATEPRALLGTLPAAGVPVTWRDGSGAAGGALQLQRLPGPGGVLEVRAVAGPSAALVLRDRGGTLDSLPMAAGAVQGWRLAAVDGAVTVAWPALASRVPLTEARAAPAPSRAPGVVRLIARPGWEAKFTAAALEEAGWSVEGRWAVSPVAAVTIGRLAPLDTARHAAVVVLDSVAAPADVAEAAAIRRFVAAGGGVVLAGNGVRWPPAQSLAAAGASAIRPAAAGALLSPTPREGLDRWRLVPVAGAQVLARAADGGPVLAARTLGRGRTVAVAYRDSWRWRMAGSDEGLAAHRDWWDAVLRLAAGTAPAQAAPAGRYPGDGAPWLDLVARLGPPAPAPLALREGAPAAAASSAVRGAALVAVRQGAGRHGGALFLLAAALLLLEWADRRRHGDP